MEMVPKEKVGVFHMEMDGLRMVAHEMGWGSDLGR